MVVQNLLPVVVSPVRADFFIRRSVAVIQEKPTFPSTGTKSAGARASSKLVPHVDLLRATGWELPLSCVILSLVM